MLDRGSFIAKWPRKMPKYLQSKNAIEIEKKIV